MKSYQVLVQQFSKVWYVVLIGKFKTKRLVITILSLWLGTLKSDLQMFSVLPMPRMSLLTKLEKGLNAKKRKCHEGRGKENKQLEKKPL